LTPLIGAFCILRVDGKGPNSTANINVAAIWSAGSVLTLTTLLLVLATINDAKPEYFHNYFLLEANGASVYFMEVAALATLLGMLVAQNEIKFQAKKFAVITLLLEALSMILFSAENVFIFSAAFGSIVFILHFLSGVFTTTEHHHGRHFSILFLGAVFVIFGSIYIGGATGISELRILSEHPISSVQGYVFFTIFSVGLCAMLGLFPLHLWIFESYANSPCAVAMLLGGIGSLVGGYGAIAVLIPITRNVVMHVYNYAMYFALISVIYSLLLAVIQTNLKSVLSCVTVCYSAIAVVGIFSCDENGFIGGVYCLLASGVVSSLLFCVVYVTEARGALRHLSTIALIPLLALVATPLLPFFSCGFFITVGLLHKHLWLGIILCVGMTWGMSLIAKLIYEMLFCNAGEKKEISLSKNELVYLLLPIFFILLIGLFPQTIITPLRDFGRQLPFATKHFSEGGFQ
jgi:NADH-quinone oxidoreductase subunit M